MARTKIPQRGSPSDLEAQRDRLFAARFADFIQVRKTIVTELRANGERSAADAIAAAKRPTRSAWALNQVARRHPGEMAAFLATVARVRAMQKHALERRDTDAVRESGRAMNAGVSRILGLAREALAEDGGKASSPLERAIAGALRAVPFASMDDVERLQRGALTADLTAPDDLTVFGAIDFAPDPEAPTPPSKAPATNVDAAAKRRARQEAARARAEAERRARRAAKLAQVAKDAERDAARLEREAEAAGERARRLEEEARAARAKADDARAAVDAESARSG